MQLGVEHLDTGRSGDVGGGHCARTRLAQVHGDGLVVVARQHQPLEVEDDLGDILDHPGQGAELVLVALDLDAGDRCARNGRQQRPAQRVAQCVTEARLQRLDDEP
ncbi:hypothetical protein SDC9_184546 [bioreactor metagenome]|uniref:Uncharacterized protein n=1 Tax=bioreactor metagenome TaxID=1076179 RepID=A0A645HE83_9ZZZZ